MILVTRCRMLDVGFRHLESNLQNLIFPKNKTKQIICANFCRHSLSNGRPEDVYV